MSLSEVRAVYLFCYQNAVALPVIRALGDTLPHHITLHLVSHENDRIKISRSSKYVKSCYTIKKESDECFVSELSTIIRNPYDSVLLPLDEHYIGLFSKMRKELTKRYLIPPVPHPQAFDILVNKAKLNEFLCTHQLPHPKSLCIEAIKSNKGSFPCLIKPVRGSSGYGIRRIDRPSEITKHLTVNQKKYVVQEFIPGEDLDCSLFAINGKIKAITVQRGVESEGFNFSTAVKFEKNIALMNLVKDLVKKTNYSGVAHLDFRLDSRDHQPKLIDFNARFWLSLLASKAAGVNFAYIYVLSALRLPIPNPDYKEITYFMGKSTINYHINRPFAPAPSSPSYIYTDLRSRLKDPLPELLRLISPAN